MRKWGRYRGIEAETKPLGQKNVGQRTDRGLAENKERDRAIETRTMGTERRGWAWNSEMGLISSFILPHS